MFKKAENQRTHHIHKDSELEHLDTTAILHHMKKQEY